MFYRLFGWWLGWALIAWLVNPLRGDALEVPAERPNIVIIFTDDQGYGDLSCYGSETINTPRLDSLAKDGTKFTSFYAQVVCGPSRSALLTGRYPNRSLGWSMPASEITIAQLLKEQGYATACVGKWDVSNRAAIPDRMPRAKGFDYYYGPLGANDDGSVTLHENDDEVGRTTDMASLTRTYTDKCIDFISQNKDKPFFVYLAHTMTHSVIDASPEFKGKSKAGLFGDTVEELDFHSGRLLDAIDQLGLRDKTLVIFTTDNGPWNNMQENLRKRHNGQVAWGSSGPLREGKGSTYEGGLRVPCLVRWPGKVPAGRTSDAIFATIDFLPTLARLGGAVVPSDRLLDGVDQTDLLLGKSQQGARNNYFYFCKNELHGVRKGNYKLLLSDRRQHYGYVKDKGSNDFELYDLANDLGEKRNIAKDKPEIVQELKLLATSVPWPDTAPDDRIALVKPNPRSAEAKTQLATELKLGKWAEHQLPVEVENRVARIFQEGIQREIVPGGSILIMQGGEVLMRKAYGLADLESNRPFAVDDPLRIASITKPHTATLLAILAEHGKLRLEDTVDVYLPELKSLKVRGQGAAHRAPTLLECLSHTAGFPGNQAMGGREAPLAEARTLEDAVVQLSQQELTNQPGDKYDYSRAGYLIAGRVAEVVTGRTYQDLLRRHLLEPIGAQVSTFSPSADLIAKLPTSYQQTNQGLTVRQREAMPQLINPAGGLVSSLDDVARLMLLHRNHGKVGNKVVLSDSAIKRMWQPQPATPGNGYGLGFNIVARHADGSPKRIRHTGASGTFAMLDFDQDLIVVIMTQVDQNDITQWRNRLMQAIGS